MFYISNVEAWLEEVIQKCNEEGLNPSSAFFMMVLFSSLDTEYVTFFKEKREQISSFSGKNFHILTPIVYHNDIVPDEEWRSLRKKLRASGIKVSNQPSMLLFCLKSISDTKFEPIFFAGFNIPSFNFFELAFRYIVDVSYGRNPSDTNIAREIEVELKLPNLIGKPVTPNVDLVQSIQQKLSLGRVFLSHSSHDKQFVRKLRSALADERVEAWLDEQEVRPGDHIRKMVSEGIQGSNVLAVVISPSSVKSHWVQFELAQFIGMPGKRKIIPILFGAKPEDLPNPFREIQDLNYIDFTNKKDWQKNIVALRKAIESFTQKSHSAKK